MSTPDQQLAFSARFLRRSVALACAALLLLLLGSSANASSTVLQFGQINPFDIITATEVAGVTTLSTAGNVDGGGVSVPVTITNFLGTPGLAIPAFETFVGVTSTGPATGSVSQNFSGTIEFTSAPGGAGINFLTATFGPGGGGSSPTLAGASGGLTANLTASNPPHSLGLTTDPIFTTILSPSSSMNIAIGNIAPALGTSGGSIASFTAQNSGTFSASVSVIPEPGTLCLASFGVVFGVIVYRKKR